jgi:solute carrier family 25 protein 39/40
MATATQRAEDADQSAGIGEVSLGQKMLSAVSGSILTSLLGVYPNLNTASQTSQKTLVVCIGVFTVI